MTTPPGGEFGESFDVTDTTSSNTHSSVTAIEADGMGDVHRLAMEAAGYGLAVLSTSLRIVYANPMLPRLLEIDVAGTLLGQYLAALVEQTVWSNLNDHLQRCCDGLSSVEECELRLDSGRWLEVRIDAIDTADAQGAGVLLTLVDVTEIRRIESDLRNSRETLRAITDVIPAMISAVDAENRVVLVNKLQADVLGVSFTEAQGRHAEDLTDTDFAAYDAELNQLILATGEGMPFFEETIGALNDSERVLLTTKALIPSSEAEGRVETISFDITDRKKAEREREALIEELERRNEELERFSYRVSHDLRSPLITLRGFIGLLNQDIDSGDPNLVAKDLDQIQGAAERMQHLLQDLLALSQVGQLMKPPVAIELRAVIEEAVGRVSGALSASRVRVEVGDSMPRVVADFERLVEVLQNLLENAIKFSPADKDSVVQVGAIERPQHTELFVKDSGPGINPSYHERVFGLFERLDQSTLGTGIGLALVKRIVQEHGGQVWIESTGDGSGTTVWFTLPRVTPVRG